MPPVRASIVGLLLRRGPSAILWRIVPVIVDAVDASTWRSHAHVTDKVLEHHPAVAHADAAPSVVLERWMFFVIAALLHLLPCAILPRLTHAVRGFRRHDSAPSTA